ncbi:hypothetical protein NP493_769g01008 [Ridgeia piscesae]|uniref:Uncharacterized protein n=1 Tax=Ridgeia piscesae TaxID=27915 RepID=A0AAD9KP31_RIDPI|nr:hypothetical protein NP493_769g01008 [Ridgeia piscesae]
MKREPKSGREERPRSSTVDWRDALRRKLVIRNEAIRECISECFGTFLLLVFGYAAIATYILGGEGVTPLVSVNLGWGFGVALAVWVSMSVSGAHVNPSVTVALVVIGKFPLRKVPHYLLGQYAGGFLAAALVYCVYLDALNSFDGGVRSTTGANATAVIFTTVPNAYLTALSAVQDQLVGTAILLVGVLAMTDQRNPHRPSPGLFPLCIGLYVASLTMCYALNMGAPINPARDLPSRIFLVLAGWGTEPFSLNNYNYFWIPVVVPHIGAILGAILYEVLISVQIPDTDHPDDVSDTELIQRKAGDAMQRRTRRLLEVSSGREQRKIGRCGSSMLRPSPNHGAANLTPNELPLVPLDTLSCRNGAPNSEVYVCKGRRNYAMRAVSVSL